MSGLSEGETVEELHCERVSALCMYDVAMDCMKPIIYTPVVAEKSV